MVIYQKHIYRQDLRANPNVTYLFGDNTVQEGFAGQAKEMRGEPNAVGIPTKKYPNTYASAYFTDNEFESNKREIDDAFARINTDIVVVPLDGLGTGLAEMPIRCPKTFKYLVDKIKALP